MTRERPALGVKLRDLRERRRFTRDGLGMAAGLSDATVAKIENGYDPRTGKAVRPNPDTLRKLADALGEGLEEDADRFYTELMKAAGYAEGLISDQAAPPRPVWDRGKPPIPVITRGISNNPDIPEAVQQKIIELLERTEALNRALRDEDEE